MKKYFLYAILISAAAFTACSSDDSSDIEADVPGCRLQYH